MTGSFNFRKFSTFLKSFWGILASFSAILPTIIYIINTKLVKDSVISEYYIGIPTTFALLAIPFAFLFEDKLAILSNARKTSIIFASIGLITLFAFVTMKAVYVTKTYYKIRTINDGYEEWQENNRGEIEIATFEYNNKEAVKQVARVNILEIVALIMYSISIISITSSFAIVGVFFYTKS